MLWCNSPLLCLRNPRVNRDFSRWSKIVGVVAESSSWSLLTAQILNIFLRWKCFKLSNGCPFSHRNNVNERFFSICAYCCNTREDPSALVIHVAFMLPSTMILPNQAECIYNKQEEKRIGALTQARVFLELDEAGMVLY
jgi:hypothetical protein